MHIFWDQLQLDISHEKSATVTYCFWLNSHRMRLLLTWTTNSNAWSEQIQYITLHYNTSRTWRHNTNPYTFKVIFIQVTLVWNQSSGQLCSVSYCWTQQSSIFHGASDPWRVLACVAEMVQQLSCLPCLCISGIRLFHVCALKSLREKKWHHYQHNVIFKDIGFES